MIWCSLSKQQAERSRGVQWQPVRYYDVQINEWYSRTDPEVQLIGSRLLWNGVPSSSSRLWVWFWILDAWVLWKGYIGWDHTGVDSLKLLRETPPSPAANEGSCLVSWSFLKGGVDMSWLRLSDNLSANFRAISFFSSEYTVIRRQASLSHT